MLENLQNGFQKALKSLRGEAKVRPQHIEEALKSIRESLLEADVQFAVVKRFLETVKEKALGQSVAGSLSPYQQFVYVLQKEMLEILGGQSPEFNLSYKPPVVVLMAGLQGSGKTTTSAKLGFHAKKKLKRKPLLVSVDVRRPAAIEQLERLAEDAKLDYINPESMDPVARATEALEYARTYGLDFVIVDTAGRLSIDEELMEELNQIKSHIDPQHVFYVADAMSGQQALEVAEGFSKRVGLTGAMLSKSDADARGGVVLSIREALGVPLLFVGTGEKFKDFEAFHPDRWVSRILGMGDLDSLVEKVEEVQAEEKSKGRDLEKTARKAMKGKMSLLDFQDQMKMMKKLGSMKNLMGMVPGMGAMANQVDNEQVEKKLKKIDAMINSMTPLERERADILNGSRKRRVAKGSGSSVEELNQFLREFQQMQKMMKMMKGRGGLGNLKKLFG